MEIDSRHRQPPGGVKMGAKTIEAGGGGPGSSGEAKEIYKGESKAEHYQTIICSIFGN